MMRIRARSLSPSRNAPLAKRITRSSSKRHASPVQVVSASSPRELTEFDRFVQAGGSRDILNCILEYLTDQDVLLGFEQSNGMHQMNKNFSYTMKSRVKSSVLVKFNPKQNKVIRLLKYDAGAIFIPHSVIDLICDRYIPLNIPPNLLHYVQSYHPRTVPCLPPTLLTFVGHGVIPRGVFPSLHNMELCLYEFNHYETGTAAIKFPVLTHLTCDWINTIIPPTVRHLTLSKSLSHRESMIPDYQLTHLKCVTHHDSFVPYGVKYLDIESYLATEITCDNPVYLHCIELTLRNFRYVPIKNAPMLEKLTLVDCVWDGQLDIPPSVTYVHIDHACDLLGTLSPTVKHLRVEVWRYCSAVMITHIEVLEIDRLMYTDCAIMRKYLFGQFPTTLNQIIMKGISYTAGEDGAWTVFIQTVETFALAHNIRNVEKKHREMLKRIESINLSIALSSTNLTRYTKPEVYDTILGRRLCTDARLELNAKEIELTFCKASLEKMQIQLNDLKLLLDSANLVKVST